MIDQCESTCCGYECSLKTGHAGNHACVASNWVPGQTPLHEWPLEPIEKVLVALNRVLEIDRAAIQYLLIGSVETCEEMLADPLLQVEEIIHTDGSKNHRVSPLALLNMVVEAATGQRIAAQFEIEGRTVEAARQKQRDDRVGRSVICPFLVKFTPYEPDAENRTEATT